MITLVFCTCMPRCAQPVLHPADGSGCAPPDTDIEPPFEHGFIRKAPGWWACRCGDWKRLSGGTASARALHAEHVRDVTTPPTGGDGQ